MTDIQSDNPKTTRKLTINKSDRQVVRYEFDFLYGHIKYPGSHPRLPELPIGSCIPFPVEPGYVEQYLRYYILPDKAPGEHYTYGQDMAWQIQWIIDHYKQLGVNRHCCMSIGKPESLLFYDNPETASSQCLRLVDTCIKDGKLHFSITFRSWNLWSGLPANLACLQMVKEYMAEEIGVEDGEMFISCMKAGLDEIGFDLASRIII